MKIGFLGLDLPEGKVKYADPVLIELERKFRPDKVSPYFAECLKGELTCCEGILVSADRLLDLILPDMDKLEGRLSRSEDEGERSAIAKALAHLEEEIPLCDVAFDADELVHMRALAPVSLKPVLVEASQPDVNDAIERMLRKAGLIFFYTAAKREVHAWRVERDADVVTCAGQIHSDLARGFIRAEIVNFSDFATVYNMQEARSKGFVSLVDRDYRIREGDIVDVRFSV